MKLNLLKPNENILEERVRHLEETVTILLRRQVAITELLKTHGTLFIILKKFFDQLTVEGIVADTPHNDIDVASVDPSAPLDNKEKDEK